MPLLDSFGHPVQPATVIAVPDWREPRIVLTDDAGRIVPTPLRPLVGTTIHVRLPARLR